MYIQNIACNSFYGTRSNFIYTKKHVPAVKADLKEEFYGDIDKYLDRTYNKKRYFSSLGNCVKALENLDNFTEAEKQYLDELIVAIDEAGGIDKIPEEYLRTLMENLLAKKNAQ